MFVFKLVVWKFRPKSPEHVRCNNTFINNHTPTRENRIYTLVLAWTVTLPSSTLVIAAIVRNYCSARCACFDVTHPLALFPSKHLFTARCSPITLQACCGLSFISFPFVQCVPIHVVDTLSPRPTQPASSSISQPSGYTRQ